MGWRILACATPAGAGQFKADERTTSSDACHYRTHSIHTPHTPTLTHGPPTACSPGQTDQALPDPEGEHPSRKRLFSLKASATSLLPEQLFDHKSVPVPTLVLVPEGETGTRAFIVSVLVKHLPEDQV